MEKLDKATSRGPLQPQAFCDPVIEAVLCFQRRYLMSVENEKKKQTKKSHKIQLFALHLSVCYLFLSALQLAKNSLKILINQVQKNKVLDMTGCGFPIY